MTVTVNATATAQTITNTATTLSNANLTTVSGATCVLAWIMFGNSSVSPTAISLTCNSSSMTLLATATNSGSAVSIAQLYGILSPSIGVQTVVANWTTGSQCVLDTIAFAGTATDTIAHCFPNANNATGSSAAPAITGVSATGNINVFGVAQVTQNVNSLTATGSTTVFIDNTNVAAGGGYAPGASSVAWTASLASSGTWACVCCDVSVPPSAKIPFNFSPQFTPLIAQ